MYKLNVHLRRNISTRSRIEGKDTKYIPITKIRPTNTVSQEFKIIKFSPIIVIKADDDYYYIADGNHRFFVWLLTNKSLFIPAWILEDGDQKRLIGDPLPTYLKEWKEGKIDLKNLCVLAKNAYFDIEDEIKKDLMIYNFFIINGDNIVEPQVKNKKFEKVELKNIVYDIALSILNLIQGKTSLERESSILKISKEELAILHKCFIDGGIKAIKEKLKNSKFK